MRRSWSESSATSTSDATATRVSSPTVVANVDNSERIAQEEIFGPVVTITPYDSDEEAIRLANDSEYGLGGSVWTADEERGLDVARRVRTGTIGVNYYQ